MRVPETERIRFYDRGRICAHPGCATILSVYDPARYCAPHLQQAQPHRRRMALAAREGSCECCGTCFETLAAPDEDLLGSPA